MKNTKLLFGFLTFFFLFSIKSVSAHCPLCVAATGSSVLVARQLGVSDLVIGTLIGAFTVSTALWLHIVLKRRNDGKNYIPFQAMIIILLSMLLTLIGFSFTISMVPSSKWFGLSDISFGLLVGFLVTSITFWAHEMSRKLNGNRNFLPFQGIVFILLATFLTVSSLYLAGLA